MGNHEGKKSADLHTLTTQSSIHKKKHIVWTQDMKDFALKKAEEGISRRKIWPYVRDRFQLSPENDTYHNSFAKLLYGWIKKKQKASTNSGTTTLTDHVETSEVTRTKQNITEKTKNVADLFANYHNALKMVEMWKQTADTLRSKCNDAVREFNE